MLTRRSRRQQNSLPVSPDGTRLDQTTSDWCRHLANWTKHTRCVLFLSCSLQYVTPWSQNRKKT